MKKKMIVLLAAALMTLGASNAMAAWSSADLYRVVYDRAGTVEVVTDLGSVTSLQTASNLTIGGGAAAFTSYMNTAAGANNYVAYFAKDTTAQTSPFWVAVADSQTQAQIGGLKGNTLNTAVKTTGFAPYYSGKTQNSNGTEVTAVGVTTDVGSYNKTLSGTAPGSFLSVVAGSSIPYVENSLANLANAAVNMKLFYFANANASTISTTTYLTLRTNADGSTTVNASSTPIPAAIYLMGSGLLGLVGLRRKNRA